MPRQIAGPIFPGSFGGIGMAVSRRLSPGATAYVWAVVVLGAIVCAGLVLGGDPEAWNAPAILLFGSLGVLATAVSFSYQGVLPSVIVHQIGAR